MRSWFATVQSVWATVPLFLVVTMMVNVESYSSTANTQVEEVDVIRAQTGSGPGDIGIATPPEANPEGPMSFAISDDGQEVFVLDQVNSRIQVFKNGKKQRSIPIGNVPAKDLELLPGGKIALLTANDVIIISSQGQLLRSIALKGILIPSPEDALGVYARTIGKWKGLWVDVGERSVRIATLDPEVPSSERISVPGKISVNGLQLIRLEIHGTSTATVHRSKTGNISDWDTEFHITFPGEIHFVNCFCDDNMGRLYIAVTIFENNRSTNMLVILNPKGKEIARLNLFVQKAPHEIFRSMRISPNGDVFHMAVEDKNVFIKKYSTSTLHEGLTAY